MKLEPFDMKAFVAARLKQKEGTHSMNEYGGAVAREVEKVKISHCLEQREYTHTDGSKGDVAKTLTIVIDFSDVVLQPHADFEEMAADKVAEFVEDEVYGYMDICADEAANEAEDATAH